MLLRLVHVSSGITLNVREKYVAGKVNVTRQKLNEIEGSSGVLSDIGDWSALEDLDELIERDILGLDQLPQNEWVEYFLPQLDDLEDNAIANFELVDSDDPLEAGLEMLVSPPGKRLQSITLLSGGEQALTALSLIFAVFLVNPSPICVLDEVDAPLDDANVTRFCSLLDELTNITKTRFIIITHHALTMSRMHRLYGITMPEKGISQLVAVDLEKAEELVA